MSTSGASSEEVVPPVRVKEANTEPTMLLTVSWNTSRWFCIKAEVEAIVAHGRRRQSWSRGSWSPNRVTNELREVIEYMLGDEVFYIYI